MFLVFFRLFLYVSGFLVIYRSGNDRKANPPTFLERPFLVLTRLKTKIGNQEGFRVPNYPSVPVLRALFRASAQRGVLVNGSASHDVKKNYHPG